MCQVKYDKVYIEMFPLLTKKFSSISEVVRAYEKQLTALDQADLATTIRTIQEHESSKLQTTLRLHALRKDYSFRALSFQRASPDDWSVAPDQGVHSSKSTAAAVPGPPGRSETVSDITCGCTYHCYIAAVCPGSKIPRSSSVGSSCRSVALAAQSRLGLSPND